MSDMVTIADCRAAGYCIRNGVRPKCEALGLDFRTLVREGLPLSAVEGIEDSQVQRIIRFAKMRMAQNG